jgi:septum formation protein
MNLILASNSPRRKELLRRDGFNFTVMKSNAKEVVEKDPAITATKNAELKAEDVFNSLVHKQDFCVLSADTVVYFNGEILGKPKNEQEAFDMLKKLSGNTHLVITGFCIKTKKQKFSAAVQSAVSFNELSDQFIKDYIATGSPLDKAGAYGIQDANGIVKAFYGSYDNIMGLPTEAIEPLLIKILRGC